MKEIHKDNDLYLIPGHDLNKMIAVTKLLLKLKPNLNEMMMSWLGYLHDIQPQDNCMDENEWSDWHDYWDDDFVNQDGSVEHKDLDDLMWKMGLKLPSWDDDPQSGDNNEG